MIVSGIDFRSSPMELRHASTERPLFVIVPERRFLAIDGIGRPGAEDFRQAKAALRAVSDIGVAGEQLRGPTGVVIGPDPVAAAKVLADFARENDQKPGIKGGLLDGRSIGVDQVKALASLPSREQMLAELAGGLQAPLAGFVGALNGLLYMFAGALDALRTQREGA